MKKSIWKVSLREIAQTWNRFLAIVIIVALGVAFFTGLKAVGPDMNYTATRYFTTTNMMDYKLVSNIGFNDDDVAAVAALPGISQVDTVCSLDAILQDDGDSRVVHVMSLPVEGGINGLSLVQGRLPESASECVVDNSTRYESIDVGSAIKLVSGTDDEDLGEKLAITLYTVVGKVNAPNYLNRDRGTSSIGNGQVTGLVYVSRTNFTMDVYTELFATISGSHNVLAFGAAYDKLVQSQDESMDDLAFQRETIRHQEILDEANETLAEKQQELDEMKADAEKELADAQIKLDDATQQLNDAIQELADARARAEAEFEDAENKIESAENKLAKSRREYNDNREAYEQQVKEAEVVFTQAQQQIDGACAQIAQQAAAVQVLKDQLEQGIANGTLTAEQIAVLQQQIAQGEAAIAQATAQVQAMEAELAAQKQQLADAGAQLDQLKNEIDSGSSKIKKMKADLEDARTEAEQEFADAEVEIKEKRQELANAQTELTDARNDTEQKISDAQVQLDDARQKIADIPDVNWVVLGRDDNAGYADFNAAISRTGGLSSIFPMFFFLIAALVCMTTMTRMVDEQRTQIGTLKAFGYGKGSIAFKYLFYAGTASILGCALGLVVGFLFIPRVIMITYNKLYTLPALLITFRAADTVVAMTLALGSTVVTAMFTCWRAMIDAPASLMRPKAPKAGKRVILERIEFVWKRLSFSYKVTARNLLRYKKRFWMTVLGVAGCSALLLTGLGLRDSIATQVSDRQFGQLFLFDMSFQVKDDMSSEVRAAIDSTLAAADAEQTSLKSESVTASAGYGTENCTLMVPMAPDSFPDYIVLRDLKTSLAVELPESGAVLTQKLSEILGVMPGDRITVTDSDNKQAEFTVAAIAENYISHIITMSPAAYHNAFGQDAIQNTRMVNLPEDMTHDSFQALAMELNALDGVNGIRFQQDNIDEFHGIINSLDYIVWVIMLAAAVLAFAVLYTLTSINISERFREIATIKVLGFYDRETAAYIFRESYILTLLGIALGLVLGVIMHGVVLDSLEVDAVMFVRQILPQSYAISAALTMVFTWIVNKLALGKISKINMVEALKGVE